MSDSTVSLNTPHGSPGSQLHCVIFRWIPIRSLCCMPAGHGGWRSSLVLLPRCLWSRSRFDGPLWGRWPRIGWYLWVSDPGSAGMGHRCSSSGVGRHDDMSCRLSQVSLLFYCNIFFQICLSVLPVWNGCIRTYTCSCRRDSRLELSIPGLAFPLVPHTCVSVLGYHWFR